MRKLSSENVSGLETKNNTKTKKFKWILELVVNLFKFFMRKWSEQMISRRELKKTLVRVDYRDR